MNPVNLVSSRTTSIQQRLQYWNRRYIVVTDLTEHYKVAMDPDLIPPYITSEGNRAFRALEEALIIVLQDSIRRAVGSGFYFRVPAPGKPGVTIETFLRTTEMQITPSQDYDPTTFDLIVKSTNSPLEGTEDPSVGWSFYSRSVVRQTLYDLNGNPIWVVRPNNRPLPPDVNFNTLAKIAPVNQYWPQIVGVRNVLVAAQNLPKFTAARNKMNNAEYLGLPAGMWLCTAVNPQLVLMSEEERKLVSERDVPEYALSTMVVPIINRNSTYNCTIEIVSAGPYKASTQVLGKPINADPARLVDAGRKLGWEQLAYYSESTTARVPAYPNGEVLHYRVGPVKPPIVNGPQVAIVRVYDLTDFTLLGPNYPKIENVSV